MPSDGDMTEEVFMPGDMGRGREDVPGGGCHVCGSSWFGEVGKFSLPGLWESESSPS